MNVCDMVVMDPSSGKAACCPRAKGGTVFVAVMQGEVILATAAVETLLLPACSLLYGPAALVAGLSAGDDALGITWSVDDAGIVSMTEFKTRPMDELTAIVLQDAAFEAPDQPMTMVEGASCSRSETLEAALGYLSHRVLENENQGKCGVVMPEASDKWVRQARQLMEASLDSPLTLADLAAELACSPATLVRAFKASGLSSPIRYFAERRVEHAKASLQQSELSVSNIAASLGFRDLATFSHFFRKHTGQSPRDYRLNCRWLL